jgi:hypothetical protein
MIEWKESAFIPLDCGSRIESFKSITGFATLGLVDNVRP